jgi:alpha-ketoglutarate-dependent taurine dioxygenase
MVSFTITPLTDHTGAEIVGLDFIDIETRVALQRGLADHHVLVMRDQRFTPDSSRLLRGCSASFISSNRAHDRFRGRSFGPQYLQ